MRLKLLVVALVAVAALAAATVAAADTMHPELAAHLSGMGEHGMVNLQSRESEGRLCWTFDVMASGTAGATIRDAHGTIVARLGMKYEEKGCATVPKKALLIYPDFRGVGAVPQFEWSQKVLISTRVGHFLQRAMADGAPTGGARVQPTALRLRGPRLGASPSACQRGRRTREPRLSKCSTTLFSGLTPIGTCDVEDDYDNHAPT
jgi:hypothetical protein